MAAIPDCASRPMCSIFRAATANRRSVRSICGGPKAGRANSRSRTSTAAATSIRHGKSPYACDIVAATDTECATLDPNAGRALFDQVALVDHAVVGIVELPFP